MRREAFTLLELTLVVAILGIVAGALALQSTSGDTERRLDTATSEVAAALRFARSEALRTGEPHGVRAETAGSRLRVFSLDTTGATPVETFTVRNPVDKKLYDLTFPDAPFMEGVSVQASDFRFGGSAVVRQAVAFDADGTPVSPLDLAPLDSGLVRLSKGTVQREVTVAPVTGRVSLQ